MLPGLVDLASETLGGAAISASDEFFAPKENLLKSSEPVFIPDRYTDQGKWMDGWESRRKRAPGHDWCIVRLGLAGRLRVVDVDTTHFLGNFPSHCSLDASDASSGVAHANWTSVLPRVRLQGGGHNLFDIDHPDRFTHARLNIFPDGGVARLRVFGEVIPDFERLRKSTDPVDLASVVNGGRALAASDCFFGSLHNLILPGRSANMGEGWETKRRRGPGYDWIIVRLGARSLISKIAVETDHYKGNYPDRCSIDSCDAADSINEDLVTGRVAWREILPASKLDADAVHVFERELAIAGPCTHVRLSIYPDGGISRLRVFAKIVE